MTLVWLTEELHPSIMVELDSMSSKHFWNVTNPKTNIITFSLLVGDH